MPSEEENTTAETGGADESQESHSETGGDVDYKAEADKWKALARQNEKQAKANAEKASRYDEVIESQKSEAQKTADRLAEAEKVAKDSKVRAIRAEVAALKGVPAELLTGETESEVEESASALMKFRGDVRPDFGAGNRGKAVGGERVQWTRADLKGKTPAEIEAARKEGLLDSVMGKRR